MKSMESRSIEIRAAEGGEDARLFVAELAQAYCRLADREGWKHRAEPALDLRTGHQRLVLTVTGPDLTKLSNESGAQRLQRIPPTERAGRVHSSTVTVSIMGSQDVELTRSGYQRRSKSDFIVDWYGGTTKAGGQHRNKHATSCRLTHIPSGLVRTAQTRSRVSSMQLAEKAMFATLDDLHQEAIGASSNALRRQQLGTGERAGEKRRTWRFKEDMVVDHVTNRRARAAEVMAGRFDLLWE